MVVAVENWHCLGWLEGTVAVLEVVLEVAGAMVAPHQQQEDEGGVEEQEEEQSEV